MSFDAHPGSGDFVTRPAVHIIQNIRQPRGDSRGLWPAVPDAWWPPRFSSLTIRSRERLRLMIIMVSPAARPTAPTRSESII